MIRLTLAALWDLGVVCLAFMGLKGCACHVTALREGQLELDLKIAIEPKEL